ncbi:Ger(x)C family spore germination protein [Cohnella lubricantis]|uniref:Ger(X)C family spore germination protein n=1 Tax=Cohnella lubricantis TaxID=2163172 RepID=A0A841TEN1_9BACL|nr:Ger(x)C family spore germination protein [Cohnella lubricantis]MBB6678525.1 Ger(x)C family spore germination protein [Cohnella lubricantis]MBP2119166.1 spore germination protein KC [Cohnella lubricantis]
MRIAWIPAALFIVLLLAGCTNRSFKDIDKRLYVMAIGIDRPQDSEELYRLSFKLGLPSPGTGVEQNRSIVVSQESDSLPESIRLLKAKFDKEVDFNHTKLLIFGDSLARSDISQVVDYFVRRRDIQGIALLAVGSPNAEQVLKVSPKSEVFPGNSLFLSFEDNGTSSAYTVTEYLFDFFRRMYEDGLDPYMPVIEPAKDYYVINKVALFDKSKIIGILPPRETKSFKELLEQNRKMDMIVRSREEDFTMQVDYYRRRFSFYPKDNHRMIVKVKVGGNIEQTKEPVYDRNWADYEQAAAHTLRDQYLKTLNQLRDWRVDPFGFGLIYKAVHYRGDADWTRWEQMYPSVEFDIRPEVRITGTGIIR